MLGEPEEQRAAPLAISRTSHTKPGIKALSLISKGLAALDVEGAVLQAPTKTGAGISKYYRTRMA